MRDDEKIPPFDDKSFWKFFEERRWCREYRGEYRPGKYIFTRESKFRTGEASITIETLRREWPTWNDDERGDFTGSFHTDDVGLSMEVFRYFVSLAVPEDRYRYMRVFDYALDVPEAFGVLSEWILASDTKARRLLFQPLVGMADKVGREKAVAVLEDVLDGILEDGEFWRKAEKGTVPPEQASEMSECLAALGWLGKAEIVFPLLERLAGAVPGSSKRARELLASGKSGKWSLT